MSRDKQDQVPGSGSNPFAALRGKFGAGAPADSPRTPAVEREQPPAPSVAQERITVRRERKGRGGKTVTVAEGPGLAGQDLEQLARDTARALGSGARVEDGTVVVQGDQTERWIAWLTQRGLRGVARGN